MLCATALHDMSCNFTKLEIQCMKSGELCWLCTLKTCTAKVLTVGSEYVLTRIVNEHSHASLSTKIINRQKINNVRTKKVKHGSTTRPIIRYGPFKLSN